MTDINSILQQDADVQEAKDIVAGEGGVVKNSDIYLMKVIHAFLKEADSGAIGVQLTMKHSDKNKTEFNTTIYISSGKTKGQKTYFEKNGKKFPLPGYTQINDLCLIASNGKLNLGTAPKTKKTVEVYSFTEGKKVNIQADVIDVLTGAIIKVAIARKRVNKFKGGKPTSEVTEKNEVATFLTRDGKTMREVNSNSAAEFADKWLLKNKDQVIDEVTVIGNTTSGFAQAGAGATQAPVADVVDDLFND